MLRIGKIVFAGVCGALAFVAVVLIPEFWKGHIPIPIQKWVSAWGPALFLVLVCAVLVRRPTRIGRWQIRPSWWLALDQISAWALKGRLAALLAAVAAAGLLTWLPHYLTWPWWPDTDQFATSALAWNAGIRPYRDLPDFDFPGPIYLCWLLGKLFGWGRTVPFYAFDAALLVVLGVVLVAWSRRLFGHALPGWAAYLPFLAHYLSLEYSHVAQRDWQVGCLGVLALLALEGWPGWKGRLASAACLAVAAAFRPQSILFVPAALLALDENARRPGESWTKTLWAIPQWVGACALGVVLVFAPLVVAGVADDFVRVLQLSRYGSLYNRVTPAVFQKVFFEQFHWWKFTWVLAGSVLAALFAPRSLRRTARVWCVALLVLLVYKPMSPVAHTYLDLPRTLVWSVNFGLLAQWTFAVSWLVDPARLLLCGLLVLEGIGAVPRFCMPLRSLQSLGPLVRGEDPERAPPGCARMLPDPSGVSRNYYWQDYRAVLAYLRTKTKPTTRVGNFLRDTPFPTLNGPAGRLPAFSAAGGVLWIWWIKNDEFFFAESLWKHPDSVIVWVPGETPVDKSLKLARLEEVIRRLYRFEIRFGKMEVWTRRPMFAPRLAARKDASKG